MKPLTNNWNLTILVAYSHKWSVGVAQEFRDGLNSLLADVERRMRTEHPSLNLKAQFFETGRRPASQDDFREPFAFAVCDATDYDEDLGFLAGLVQGARIPYVFVCRGKQETVKQRMGLNEATVIPYESNVELFRRNSLLSNEVEAALSQSRILEELVYELWFPRDASQIWVVCPQDHDAGEFADRSSADYTYLDNLGDTDALLEIMVFLSRYYPRASIGKFSSADLPRDHTKNNIVVIGGPGSSEDISNNVCRDMMNSMKSRVSYTPDCDCMLVALDGGQSTELRAELSSDTTGAPSTDHFKVRRDYGCFARFPNPLNESATVVLINGIHTAGVLGAARAFADRTESLRNYHSVFNSGLSPRSFECHFEVGVLNGDVKVPTIAPEDIYLLGPRKHTPQDSNDDAGPDKLAVQNAQSVVVLFVAGDRGGSQRNQIQIPREFDTLKDALNGCAHRQLFRVANPILAATHQKLVLAYRESPTILHFAGHGDDRSLSFISDQGLLVTETPLIAEQLATFLRNFPVRLKLCMFNTCNSAPIAKHLIDSHVVSVAIGWPANVADTVAIAFSKAFYSCLGDGLCLSKCLSMAAESCGSNTAPICYNDDGIDPHKSMFTEGITA